jgi:hypothetical protein
MTKKVAAIPRSARTSSTSSVVPGAGPLSKVSVTGMAEESASRAL